jgi:hypothetical protein
MLERVAVTKPPVAVAGAGRRATDVIIAPQRVARFALQRDDRSVSADSERRFAADSLLEEAVRSEPVL